MDAKNPAPLAGGDRAGIGDAGRRSDTINWRETLARLGIEVAKEADAYRLLEGADLHSLAANIDANNLIHSLVLWRAKDGDPWQLVDGRNRCAAMATLVEGDLRIEGAICLAERHEGGRIEDLIRSRNIERRHLTPDEKRARIAEVIAGDPTRSDRSIAVETGYHKNTIGSVRKKLETVGTVAHHDKRVGRDGVEQPAHKPPPSKEQQLRDLREQREKKAQNGKLLAPKIVSERQQADELLALLRRIDRDFQGLNLEAASRGLAGKRADEARAALALAEMRLAAVASVLGASDAP